MLDFAADDRRWLAGQLLALTTDLEVVSPSQWAEARRYLPPTVTPMPGPFRFHVAPYTREIVDCLGVDSPIRHVSVQKGVQLCLTTAVLENAIGYYVEHVKTAPMMLITADGELAKLRLETQVLAMLQHSGLEHLIRSSDEGNSRKTGKTERKIEWQGDGFLLPLGAQNANKLRSIPIRVVLRDEVDGWPARVGKDGDPIKLSEDRTAAFEDSRKICDLSTPTIKGQSQIAKLFQLGDQRYYFVCCVACGHSQTLRWSRTKQATGEVSGIVWDTDASGHLVPGSTRYLCESCGHPHRNDDKTRLLSPDHGAQWRPTAEPAHPSRRSYHISALYSPVGMQTWDELVRKWLEAWDVERDCPRDIDALQVFYNNVLAEPFELRGEKLRFDNVSKHRRAEYSYGQIPNAWALEHCAGPVLFLCCTVDVHSDNLPVAVWGWCRDRRVLLIDYWRFDGDTEQLGDPKTWGRLRDLIENKTYAAADGTEYRIDITLIDSGYRTDHVYQFAAEYEGAVFPVKGREAPVKRATDREFSQFTTPNGIVAYGITVDFYKDRWSASLRRDWDGAGVQPMGYFNAPIDATDRQLKELTVEVKRERIDPRTKERIGWEWRRPAGAANELWDLLVYANAALDVVAWDWCRNQQGLEAVNWPAFYDALRR